MSETTKERPILFSGEMVRAILDGRKTQTRRICKDEVVGGGTARGCPFGTIGDQLWVKETFKEKESPSGWIYRATDEASIDPRDSRPWKPSIFMPRKASRITLEITGLRVERLQEISEEDAMAEGTRAEEIAEPSEVKFDAALCPCCGGTGLFNSGSMAGMAFDVDCTTCDTYQKRYRILWESINGAGSWAANPFVWAITFKRIGATT